MLTELKPLLPPRSRTAILGVGSRLRADDYAGMAVAEALKPLADGKTLLTVEGATAPENCSGELRNFAPEAIIVVDAARMGRKPGEYSLLRPEDITGLTFSTHMLPLPVLLHYLEASCGCTTAYIGVEPADTGYGMELTPAVARGVDALVAELRQMMEL